MGNTPSQVWRPPSQIQTFKFKLKPWRLPQANNSNESSTARRCLSTCGYERVALSKSLGEDKELPVAVAQWKGMDSCQCCDERTDRQCVHCRRSVPFPFLQRSWLLSLRPLPNGNGSFLVAKSDSFFFGACSDGLPKLAVWPCLSFANQ